MLVLSRKKNETIVLDLRNVDLDSIPQEERIIKITTVDIQSGRTRQGITAHKSISCYREEVHRAIMTEETAESLIAKKKVTARLISPNTMTFAEHGIPPFP